MARAKESPPPAGSPRAVILFDGECGACNRFVQWVIRRDPYGQFLFAPLGGRTAIRAGVDSLDELHLIEPPPGAVLAGARAVQRVLARLPGPDTRTMAVLLACVPTPVAHVGYSIAARLRRRVFKRAARHCSLEAADLFLP